MDIRDVLSFSSPSPQLKRSLKPPEPPILDTGNLAQVSKRPNLAPESLFQHQENKNDALTSIEGYTETPAVLNSELEDIYDEPTTVGSSEVSEATVRRLSLLLEKRSFTNQEARTKFPDQPKRFMQSELELQECLEEMQILAANPSLYPMLATMTRPMSLLLGLLSHDNTDISLSVIDLLHELLEADALREAGPEKCRPLLDVFFNGQLIQLLMQNISRLDESNKDEADGVHKTLGIIESLLEIRPEMNVTMANQGLFTWLLLRLQRRPVFDRNKLYASELLSILLQYDESNRRQLGEVDGIDIILQQLAVYKRHDPSTREEIELMHNLFDCLCSAMMLPENKDRFLKGEGIQLMNLMLREKHMTRDSALRVLDYAFCLVASSSSIASPTPGIVADVDARPVSNEDYDHSVVVACCSKFVEVLGLRTIFPLFMHSPRERVPTSTGASKKQHQQHTSFGGPTAQEMEEHIINIVAALVRHCPPNFKSRVLAKFVENDYEKVDRLIELHLAYVDKVKAVDAKLRVLRQDDTRWIGYTAEEIEEELSLKRMEKGQLTLQVLDTMILDVCVNGTSAIMDRVLQLLKLRAASPKVIIHAVQEYFDSLDTASTTPAAQIERTRIYGLLSDFSNLLT